MRLQLPNVGLPSCNLPLGVQRLPVGLDHGEPLPYERRPFSPRWTLIRKFGKCCCSRDSVILFT